MLKFNPVYSGAARIAGQDHSMWRTLRPSAGQVHLVSELQFPVIRNVTLIGLSML